ncbi:hypothetical protein BJI47_01750 [Rhodococcus sp. 1168]|nr:hypothetical protein BJI47_01750 [Rhodococcus sp. 1168]
MKEARRNNYHTVHTIHTPTADLTARSYVVVGFEPLFRPGNLKNTIIRGRSSLIMLFACG